MKVLACHPAKWATRDHRLSKNQPIGWSCAMQAPLYIHLSPHLPFYFIYPPKIDPFPLCTIFIGYGRRKRFPYQTVHRCKSKKFRYCSPWNGSHTILYFIQKPTANLPWRCQSRFSWGRWRCDGTVCVYTNSLEKGTLKSAQVAESVFRLKLKYIHIESGFVFHQINLLSDYKDTREDNLNALFKMALERVAFLPFGLLLDLYRFDLFEGKVPSHKWNSHWEQLRYI